MKDEFDQDCDKPLRMTRRRFLKLSALAAAFPAAVSARPVLPAERVLSFYNIHTGERLKTAYWSAGRYSGSALEEINYLLRDYRSGEVKPIAPALLDLLHAARGRLGSEQPFHVVSGYRSPATNAMLAAASEGVAKHSLHMEGKAIDVYLPDRPLEALHRTALDLRGGGVGYYPRSMFVHMDVGPIRAW